MEHTAQHELDELRGDQDYEGGEPAEDPPSDKDTSFEPPEIAADRDYEEGEPADDPPRDGDTSYPPPEVADNNGR
jgi:hypothetical protein